MNELKVFNEIINSKLGVGAILGPNVGSDGPSLFSPVKPSSTPLPYQALNRSLGHFPHRPRGNWSFPLESYYTQSRPIHLTLSEPMIGAPPNP